MSWDCWSTLPQSENNIIIIGSTDKHTGKHRILLRLIVESYNKQATPVISVVIQLFKKWEIQKEIRGFGRWAFLERRWGRFFYFFFLKGRGRSKMRRRVIH